MVRQGRNGQGRETAREEKSRRRRSRAQRRRRNETAAASQYGNGSDLSTYLVDPKRSRRRLNHVIAREIPWQCKRVFHPRLMPSKTSRSLSPVYPALSHLSPDPASTAAELQSGRKRLEARYLLTYSSVVSPWQSKITRAPDFGTRDDGRCRQPRGWLSRCALFGDTRI